MRNISNKSCRGNQSTQFLFREFFFPENRDVYEVIAKIMVEQERPQMTIWRRGCLLDK